MDSNSDQVCAIAVFFSCPDDARAIEIKAKIQEMLEGVKDAKIDLRLGSPPPERSLPRG